MQTRCPECRTVFVVTSEQLRARAGRVRCGRCQAVFNAFDELVVETPSPRPETEAPPVQLPPAVETPPPEVAAFGEPDSPPEPEVPLEEPCAEQVPQADEAARAGFTAKDSSTATIAATEPVIAGDGPAADGDRAPEPAVDPVDAVRAAGMAAVRDLSEAPGYNRWAAGVLAADASAGFAMADARPLRWPYVLAALVLAAVLGGQLLYHYRVEAAARMPQLRGFAAGLGLEIGLPRQRDLVSVESADLQSDNARGLLLLQARLRNWAPYAQDWPVLDLTLTDAADRPLSRRLLTAADYLPPGGDAAVFPPAGEVAVRLWIDLQGATAAGYRLDAIYP